MTQERPSRGRGGTLVGFVVGVLVGLAVALAVAVYVTKVPVPLVDRGVSRNPGQDLLEAERNRNWNPNAALGGGSAAPAPAPASGQEGAIVVQPDAAPAPAGTEDPLGDLVRSRLGDAAAGAAAPAAGAAAADGFTYYVQAGAFRSADDAEAQRARLAMLGIEAVVSERLQSGQAIYRVRVGPFPQQATADLTKEQLAANGIDAALVRIPR
ncbi:MAG TPA: SPOR domain-containing protein [Hydrogenophaga sp.]|uniref:SPOR domain-containing protein n=1 Tax=Hydrogenophaga sp. TaxID=1904254 RepID=UPI002B75D8BD|nr:SPOR domain-containing protein [Hydrogenophaga sp.]HMN92871.1 SPOR domain-containing protein [Hydrogenophaga sp.]HMP10898.1 SPOR domain-containing protein [Hydrogenophaga sp.]